MKGEGEKIEEVLAARRLHWKDQLAASSDIAVGWQVFRLGVSGP